MRTGFADLPLHNGKAPRWLFERMKKLAREISYYLVIEFGPDEYLKRLSDPFWFQSLGCLLGFDWHSSGLTTTVTGAIKEALKEIGSEIGVFAAGGKGKTALKTPQEIVETAEKEGIEAEPLIYASKMAAKVDNSALQDGFQLYHHLLIFTREGRWAVIQQGMNDKKGYARRYHWFSENLQSFVVEPHVAVCSDWRGNVLNLVALESEEARKAITHLSAEKPEKVENYISRIFYLKMPLRHSIEISDLQPKSLRKVLLVTYEKQPENFEELLQVRGVGPKALRALALLSELIYGTKLSYRDPAKFSFAHGGKDGYPYPVDKKTYDKTIEVLEKAVKSAKLSFSEKEKTLKRLYRMVSDGEKNL